MLTREWFSASDLAGMHLPGMPTTVAGVLHRASEEGWRTPDLQGLKWRPRQARGGGFEYHFTLLPNDALARLMLIHGVRRPKAEPATPCARTDIWAWFERLPDARRAVASERRDAINAVYGMERLGRSRELAVMHVANERDVGKSTIYNWLSRIKGVPEHDWLPWLAPRHSGRSETRECDSAAWEFLKADYMRPAQPTFQDCYGRLVATAAKEGWTIPSARTLQRRLDALPEALVVLAREGHEAATRLYPAQRRDRSGFHALEAVNADGHLWDVFVQWPDGTIARPCMTSFQDLYSGLILSWRIDRSFHKGLTRLAFGDMVENHGIPNDCYFDNGRDFASKMLTGGTPNRYRFKVKDEDPQGILTSLGVTVHWTTPFHGQSKPIERAFRDMAGGIAKHPAFEGAYVGKDTVSKPANYGSKAVPLDVFLAVLAKEIPAANRRTGRRTLVCAGRSFQEAFDASYAVSPIRKATTEQRRLWLMAAEGITASKENGEIALSGNRYWSEALLSFRAQKVIVRFDPAKLHEPLHVYRLDGAYVGAAACIENTGFADADAARTHAQARGHWLKAQKTMLKAERTMTAAQVAALLPEPEDEAPPPESRVVRPVFGNVALQPRQQFEEEADDPAEERIRAARAQAFGGNRSLRVVTDDDGE